MSRIPEGWTEVKEPVLFKFDKPGAFLRGMLLALTYETLKDESTGKPEQVLVARLEMDNGELVKFRPSYNLREKLGRRLLGKQLYIVYDTDDNSTKAKGNSMKMYKVFVNPNAVAGEVPFVASDDDLPESL